jgi:hypothetical protein
MVPWVMVPYTCTSRIYCIKKIAVFWVVAPCSLVEVYQRFIGTCCIARMMVAESASETSVNFYQTIRRYNTEDSHLRTRCRENLKSYLFYLWSM